MIATSFARPFAALWLSALLSSSACKDVATPSRPQAPERVDEAAYVTSSACQSCHAGAFDAWSGSHHDRAMQQATEETVLGDFGDARFEHFGAGWEFFRDEGRFMVRTEGNDGNPAEFEVRYTFGVDPLQQYLVALPDGRMQALTIAWDSRPQEAGGQRWFSLHPNEATPAGDVLHWTGAANRWNSMCAECHSTNLRKNFDLERKRYETTWSEIDVACEACHGPGSRHVIGAEAGADSSSTRGFATDLHTANQANWVMDAETGIAHREPPRTTNDEIELCAPCHSRRSRIHEGTPGGKFLDAYRPALLEEGLYFADGQILDEVYVYGSFLQSEMYRAGVTCGDCHDPHSLRLRAPGDTLCANCHAPDRFATPSHHHHPQESPGARCVACHMPARTYMVIDERRDHSFRVPRPDLSVELGTPNACTTCHARRGAEWAAKTVRSWSPSLSAEITAQARGLAKERIGSADAARALRNLARLASAPGIARATALNALSRHPSRATADAIARAVADPDPLVRAAAARAAEALPPTERTRIASLLKDPLRSVRVEAARVLAPVPPHLLPTQLRRGLRTSLAEYRRSQEIHLDEPSAHVNLGLLALSQGQTSHAEAAYRHAIDIGAYFVPAYVNLADLYRAQGRDSDAETLLRQAARTAPESAEVQHALGLVLVRLKQNGEALKALQVANKLAPESARFAYVYGVALQSFGDADGAIATFEEAHRRHPDDPGVLQALVAVLREQGRPQEATVYAGKLEALVEEASE